MSSRIEQRRLEAAMKASLGDGDKDSSKDAKKKTIDTSSSQPAKKAKVATPRETKGGKRIPTSAGKKRRKVESESDSSESEDDRDDNSDSSSEAEEASKAVPVKKRSKVAAAPPPVDSDSSEFEDEYDDDHYKGEEDKKWMMTLNELEREAILSERRDQREIKKEAWMLQHKKKKERQADPSATSASLMTSRSGTKRQEAKKPDEKKQSVKAALEDMQARKAAATKQARLRAAQEADEDESDDKDDDDDMPTPRGDDRDEHRDRPDKFAKPRHRQVPEEHHVEQYPRVSLEAMEEVRVGRDKLIEYAREPFFSEFVQGLFSRVNIGQGGSGESRYLVCEIIGVKTRQNEYEVEVSGHRQPIKVKKALFVTHAGQKKSIYITQVSNKPFSSKEVDRWAYDMHKQNERIPSEERLGELREQLRKRWKEAFKYDAEAVDAMVEENMKNRKKTGKLVVLNKITLMEQRDEAWEEYKNLENDDEKNAAYERWEQLREQVLQMEEVEKKQQDKAIAQEKGVSTINNRNFEANRTVKKKWHLEDNDTCTREYKRTGYYVFGVGDDSKEITREKDFGKELAARQAAASAAKNKPTVQINPNQFEEEEVLSPTGALLSPKAGTPKAGAIARAHQTTLSVEVDTQATAQPKKAEEPVVLGPRPVNPLKPTVAEKPAVPAGKVTLSLEDYKRRRGLA